MKIIVSHIYGPMIKKMHDQEWRIYDNPLHYDDVRDKAFYRRISGCEMFKSFKTIGDAIRDFEKITGYDVISDTSQDGCPVFTFMCPEEKICVSGWECGKYLYDKWCDTPRKCLEKMNGPQPFAFASGLDL